MKQWHKEINKDKDFLVLSNDIDSLLGCAILSQLKGIEVSGFTNFSTFYLSDDYKGKKGIGVDLDVLKGRTFSNHKLVLDNPQAVNLNSVGGNYIEKYPFNTVMLILYTYGVDFNKFNDEQLKLLISIDSAYLGHYNDFFNKIHTRWLKKMNLDCITRVLERTEKIELDNLQRELNLKAPVTIKNGVLSTNIKLEEIEKILGIKIELPTKIFKVVQQFTTKEMTVAQFKRLDENTIFSHAQVNKDRVKCSIKKIKL